METTPNLIYILADDLGYGDISALNEKCPFKTENIDMIGENGLTFTDAHSSSAVCTPSRYSILTGRYNWRSRLKSYVMGGYSTALIEDGRTTVASMLQNHGYRTAAIGKWHIGMNFAKDSSFEELPDFEMCQGVDYSEKIEKSPVSNGFDYYFGISGSLDMPPYVYIENDHFTEIPDHIVEKRTGKAYYRKGPAGPTFVHENVLDELTDKVLNKIEEYKDNPFFIYFAMPAPHTPILPAAEFQGKSGTNEYGDFVLHCDDVVGRIRDKLTSLNLQDNTIVIFTSDNGCSPMADYPELARHGHNPSYVFRGTKADIYEGGHRIPLLVEWPARITAGKKCKQVVCLTDLMATMADILDIHLKEDEGVDSISNLPIWLNPDSGEVRDNIIHQSIDGSLSIRIGKYKLEMCPGSGGWSDPVPGQEDKLLPRFQLYDLSTDISERKNIIAEQYDRALLMCKIMRKQVLDGRSTPGPVQKNNGEEVWETVQWLNEDNPLSSINH